MFSNKTDSEQSTSHRIEMKEHTITVDGAGEFRLREDTTLLEGLQDAGMDVAAACGGLGKCGKCTVTIVEGSVSEVGPDSVPRDHAVLKDSPRDVLSCRTTPLSDLTVALKKRGAAAIEGLGGTVQRVELDPLTRKIALRLPNTDEGGGGLAAVNEQLGFVTTAGSEALGQLSEALSKGDEVTVTIARLPETTEIIKVEPGYAVNSARGIAIDVGTTTVACALFSLNDGALAGESSAYNKQKSMGADVITRITYCREEGGLQMLQEAVISTINELIDKSARAAGTKRESVDCVVVSGNTTMMHLLHGLDPKGIGEAPFTHFTKIISPVKAKDLKIGINPEGYVYTTPSISAYIGGDITSDLLASDILEEDKKSLLIDFGTNGEMVISNGERVLTASCATGPAFEGAGIACGMNGIAGAIERYSIHARTGERVYSVIGDALPEGVCGSGLIDILAALKRSGIVNERGRLIEGSSPHVRRGAQGLLEFVVATAPKGDITLNDKEVAELLMAKGALAAGIAACLKEMEISAGDLDRIIVAGGFGKHINLDNAMEIGLLPEVVRSKYEFLGNGSLKGAVLELLNERQFTNTKTIACQTVQNLQLEEYPNFESMYIDKLNLSRWV